MSDIAAVFGMMLRAQRKRVGLTQREVAERIGSIPRYIQRVEAGAENPSLTTCQQLAAAVGCELRVLFEPSTPRQVSPVMSRQVRSRLIAACPVSARLSGHGTVMSCRSSHPKP